MALSETSDPTAAAPTITGDVIVRTAQDGRAPTTAGPASGIEAKVAGIESQLSAIEQRLSLESSGQAKQNRCLALATCVGTIFWGLGDIFATSMVRP